MRNTKKKIRKFGLYQKQRVWSVPLTLTYDNMVSSYKEDKRYSARIVDVCSQLVFTSEIKIVFPCRKVGKLTWI